MALGLLPAALRTTPATNLNIVTRAFHSSRPRQASVLFALGALSNSRETQHFNKLSRLSRVEHSPPLKLIQTSEVEPFPLPAPPPRTPRPIIRPIGGSKSPLRVWDERALLAGRVVLADQARRTHRLLRTLARAKRREAKQNARMAMDRSAWVEERRKLREDVRMAGVWILASIGTATALATWRFWPAKERAPDSAELGRKLAARASAAMAMPGTKAAEPVRSTAVPAGLAPAPSVAIKPSPPVRTPVKVDPQTQTRSWKGLFWKQP